MFLTSSLEPVHFVLLYDNLVVNFICCRVDFMYFLCFSAKHSFKLQVKNGLLRKSSYTFHATDEADKLHWLQCLQSAISAEMKNTSPYDPSILFPGCCRRSDQERFCIVGSLSSNSIYSGFSSNSSRSPSEENLDADGLFCLSANCKVEFC